MIRKLVLMMLAAVVLGGCTMSGSENSETKVFDLTSPPSRAAAGMPDGDNQFTHQTKDHKAFPVQVKLPEGKQLAFDAKIVGFDSLRAADPKTGAPSTMDVQYYADSLVAGRDHLLAAVKQFGLDTAPVTKWFEEAGQPQTSPTVKTPFMRTKVGYLNLELQGRHRTTSGDQQTVIHYIFTWGGS